MAVKDLEDLKKITMLRSQIDGISVEQVMTAEFPTVSSDDRISDALSVMRETKYQDSSWEWSATLRSSGRRA